MKQKPADSVMSDNRRRFRRLGILIIAAVLIGQVFRMGQAAYLHSPLENYDEINTLNISRQSFGNIGRILSFEQNSPPYYYFLHWLKTIFPVNYIRIASGLNFGAWVGTLVLFYQLLRTLFSDRIRCLLYLTIVALLPIYYVYAYLIRMYGFWAFSSTFFCFALTKTLISDRNSLVWQAVMFLSLLMAIALHSSGLFLLPVMVAGMVVNRRLTSRVSIGMILAALGMAVWWLAGKEDLIRTFVGGMEYRTGTLPFWQRQHLITNLFVMDTAPDALAVLASLAVALIALFAVIRALLVKSFSKIWAVVAFAVIKYFALAILVPSLAARHMLVLLLWVIIAFFYGLEDLYRIRKTNVLVGVLFLALFAITTIQLERENTEYRAMISDMCLRLQAAKPGEAIIGGFNSYTLYNPCRPSGVLLYAWGKNELQRLDNLTELDALMYQSQQGGRLIPEYGVLFEKALAGIGTEHKEKMEKAFVEVNKANHIYYIASDTPPSQTETAYFEGKALAGNYRNIYFFE